MICAPAKPTRKAPAPVPQRADEGRQDAGHDPADLAATLRDLAARAHRAVRAHSRGDASKSDALLRELADLLPRIAELQRSLDGITQRDLASYLAALRREVESRMA